MRWRGKIGGLLLAAAAAVLFVSITRNTAQNGVDFTVYWRAARAVLDAGTAYSVERDGFMTFKYPPWVLPFFLPLGALPLGAAKALWGVVESASLAAAILWCLRRGARPGAVTAALVLFLPLWNVHAFDGQLSLVLLAAGILGWRGFERGARGAREWAVALALSSKLLTLFPLLGWRLRRRDLASAAGLAALVLALSGAAMALDASGTGVFQAWLEASRPGYSPTGELVISTAGLQAQGWVSAIFRLFGWSGDRVGLLYGCEAAIIAALTGAMRLLSPRLRPAETWAAWLGLAATAQPLAGFHVFVLAFPLAALALDDAFRPGGSKGVWPRRAVAVLGTLAVTAITEKLGPAGHFLQALSVKSWGVALLLASLASRRS